jgi:hypothetical protein
MKNQNGFIGLMVAVGLGLAAVFFIMTYVSYHNSAVQYETRLEGVWKENQVVLNNYTTKVQEVAQVPDMMKNDLKEVIQATFEGRYGDKGSQAVFQFIKEQNMPLDNQLYRQIQQVMESGRNDFATSQKMLVDVRMNYEAQLKYVWSGFWMRLAGFPKVELEKYKIVTLGDVRKKFETGEDSVIELR